MNDVIRWDGNDLILEVQVQPRASRDELAGVHGNRIKIRLTTPPVHGRANAALVALLAERFDVAKSHVTLLAGETGRAKRVRIKNPRRFPGGLSIPVQSKI